MEYIYDINFIAKYIYSAGIVSVIFIVMYLLTSQGLNSSDYRCTVRRVIIIFISTYIVQVLLGKSIFNYDWLLGYFISLLSILVFPILKFKTNRYIPNEDNDYPYIVIDSSKDIIFGIYTLYFCISLQEFCLSYLDNLLGIIIYIGFYNVTLLFFLSQLIYYFMYRSIIGESAILAIQSTRLSEVKEFIKFYLTKYIPFIIIILSLICICIYLQHITGSTHSTVINIMLSLIIFFVLMIKSFFKLPLILMYYDVAKYRKLEMKYRENNKDNIKNIKVNLSKKIHGTFILVIGESEAKDKMKYYNNKIVYDNTKWLSSKRTDNNFYIMNNAYSSYNQTDDCLKLALTEKSQYNDKDFSDVVSVLDIAHASGYKTYWFSHNGRVRASNTIVSVIANTAEVLKSPNGQNGIGYDHELLSLLTDVNPREDNFIVIHIMGSHAAYKSRYPDSYNKFNEDDVEAHYANTVNYTDDFLRKTYDYATENLNLQCMIYFSDHGEDLITGHNPALKNFNTVRIPMFIYLSDEYKNTRQDVADILKRNVNAYFSNDMIYNTTVGILGTAYNCYRAEEDLTSAEYAFNRNNVMTFLGKVHVSKDTSTFGCYGEEENE